MAISCGDFSDVEDYLDCATGDASSLESYLYADQYGDDDKYGNPDYKFTKIDGFAQTLAGGGYNVPFCKDFESAGTYSCLFGAENGKVYAMQNTGVLGTFADFDSIFQLIDSDEEYAAPFCADFDGDGDLDCIVAYDSTEDNDGEISAGVQYWENGCDDRYCDMSSSDFTQLGSDSGLTLMSWSSNNEFFGTAFNASIRYPKPFCIDMDEDDDLDCLIGDMDGKVHYLRNDGSLTAPSWVYVTADFFESDVGTFASPYCGFSADFDIDDDGIDIECLLGNAGGFVQRFKKINRVSNSPSFVPTALPSPVPTLAPSFAPSLSPTSAPSLRRIVAREPLK